MAMRSVLLAAIMMLAFLVPVEARPAVAPLTSGIECGCTKTGPYVSPAPGVDIVVTAEGKSPNGVYSITASGGGGTPVNLTINRVGGGTVLSLAVPGTSAWGFSPDDDRFVYHYVNSGVLNVVLYNLAVTPAAKIAEFAQATSSASISFSPNGRYLFYAALTGATNTYLKVLNAMSGSQVYQTAFTFAIVPGSGEDTYGFAGWGFSPDDSDRTLVFAYVNGSTTVAWNLVNLASASVVHSENITASSAFWQFSPCGDTIAIITQPNQSQVEVRLVRTTDGTIIPGSDQMYALASVALRSTSSAHYAQVGGTDHQLAANTAGQSCMGLPVLTAVSVNPTTVTGGSSATGTVTLSGAAPAGGLTVSLQSSNAAIASVMSSVMVPAGATQANFNVATYVVTGSATVTISASLAGTSKTASITVQPAVPVLAAIQLSQTSILGGGLIDTVNGEVDLSNNVWAGDAMIALVSSSPSSVSVPASVTIPVGQKVGYFSVTTNLVTGLVNVTISATYADVTKQAALQVEPFVPDSLLLVPTVLIGGHSATVSVSLNGIPKDPGMNVTMSSSQPGAASIPSTLLVPGGTDGASATVQTYSVNTFSSVTISTTLNGVTKSASLGIWPVAPQSLSFSRARIEGGQPMTATLTLNDLAPVGGLDVALSSSAPITAPVPASLIIPAGTISKTFYVQTTPVTRSLPVTISAAAHGVTKTNTFSILAPPTRMVTDVGTLGGSTVAYDINDAGIVVGYSLGGDGKHRAFKWQNNALTDLGTFGGTQSAAVRVNTFGQIIVNSGDGTTYKSWIYQEGAPPTDIGTLGASFTEANDINDAGHVVGWSGIGGVTKGFIYRNGQMTDLGTLGATPSHALVVNDADQVIGYSYLTPGSPWRNMFVWQNGVMLPIGGNSQTISPRAINTCGQVVGSGMGYGTDSLTTRGFRYDLRYGVAATLTLGTFGGAQSGANDVDELGRIVGYATLPDGSRHALLFDEDGYTDLNDVIPQSAGWELREAMGINRLGQIVGYGLHNGENRGFVLTLIHPQPLAVSPCRQNQVFLPLLQR